MGAERTSACRSPGDLDRLDRLLVPEPVALRRSPRRGGRAVECGGLENRCAPDWRTESSNLSPSVFRAGPEISASLLEIWLLLA
jgi:hypothetical protein